MATIDELVVKISANLKDFEKKMAKTSATLKNVGKKMSDVGGKMTKSLTLPILGVGAAAIKMATQQEDASRKLESAFESTGAAAWTTVEALQANADALQEITTHGDETIEEMQSVLLTFKNIQGTNFDLATKSILDMSDALEMDLQSASIMVGKALNDPIAGISAMSRAGITFSDEQKEMIKTMVEVGDTAGAQTIILEELGSQFGGTAEAMAETAGGKMKQAMNTMGDTMEEIGAIIIPVLLTIMDKVKEVTDWFSGLDEETQKTILVVAGIVAALGPLLMIIGKLTIAMSFLAANPIALIIAGIVALIVITVLIIKNWDKIAKFFSDLWMKVKIIFHTTINNIKDFLSETWAAIKEKTSSIWNGIKEFFINTWNSIKNTVFGIWDAITTKATDIWNGIKDFISGTVDNIKSKVVGVFESIKSTVLGIWEGLKTGIKGIINGIISGVEGMANGVVKGINKVVNAINRIQVTIPDWVPGVGGRTIGFNLRTLSEISIPRLADGAVIPPNREFLATLGDQRSGVNIETPLATMIDAFETSLEKPNGGGSNIINIYPQTITESTVDYLFNRFNARLGVEV